MVWTVPLVLPAELVDEYAIDLAAPYSTGWRYTHNDVAFSSDGDMYVLSHLGRYKHGGEEAIDPAEQSFGFDLVAWYPRGEEIPAEPAIFPHRTKYSKYGDTCAVGLAVLPEGTVALSGRYDATYLLNPDLTRIMGEYTTDPFRSSFEEYEVGHQFATRIRVAPGGRLLCLVEEYGTNEYGSFSPNLVAVTDDPLTAGHRPVLRAIASMDERPLHQKTELDTRPYVLFQGRPVGMDHRPRGFTDTVTAQWKELYRSRKKHFLGVPEPLGYDRFVVPIFAGLFRAGNRGNAFTFALVDDQGKVLGRLEGMDDWKDSPFTGECYRLATDPTRGRVYHLNRYGLYVWDADGSLLAKIATDAKPFSVLKNFTLLGCSPEGDLVLVQDKQHLMVRVPVPEQGVGEGLAAALEGALAAFAKQRAAMKKQWPQVAWHWTYRTAAGATWLL
ncbi:hypothetical protein [Nocardia sp. X0981]